VAIEASLYTLLLDGGYRSSFEMTEITRRNIYDCTVHMGYVYSCQDMVYC
jgi:hypothetical protein